MRRINTILITFNQKIVSNILAMVGRDGLGECGEKRAWQGNFRADARSGFLVSEGAQSTARNLHSRPPHRGRSERGSASGSEGRKEDELWRMK